MTIQQLESAINQLCLAGYFWTLYQTIKDALPGSRAILASDMPAEWKRQQLLSILKNED